MKNFLILMALSPVAMTVSAQEVTYIKRDNSFLEGREFLQEMNRLNADQSLPSQEKLDVDLTEGRSRSTDFLRKARIDMRLMNERTNPSTPATQPSGLGSKNAFGAR